MVTSSSSAVCHGLLAFPVGSAQFRVIVPLKRLTDLRLQAPELQRVLDKDRVDDIVRFQERRLDGGLDPLFVGDLTVCSTWGDDEPHAPLCSGRPRWLVDGQHRHAAALRIAARAPDYPLCVAMLRTGVSSAATTGTAGTAGTSSSGSGSGADGLTLSQAFEMINWAVPVPQYLIDGTIGSARRRALDGFGELFRARFHAFLSNSQAPRRPNINLGHLQDRISQATVAFLVVDTYRPGTAPASVDRIDRIDRVDRNHRDATVTHRHLMDLLPDGRSLMSFVTYANTRLGWLEHTKAEDQDTLQRAAAKAATTGCSPLYLRVNDACEWLCDPAFVQDFLAQAGTPGRECGDDEDGVGDDVKPSQKRPRMTAARGAVPKALREALWNRTFGPEQAVGHCHVCSRKVTMQDFEAGHVVARARGGHAALDNLRPVCRACNRSMGACDMTEFKDRHFGTAPADAAMDVT